MLNAFDLCWVLMVWDPQYTIEVLYNGIYHGFIHLMDLYTMDLYTLWT